MDTKKVLQQLVKIADNQQKIINKLAQHLGGGTDDWSEPPLPQKVEPAKTVHDPASVFFGAMAPQQKATIAAGPVAAGNEMRIKFKPGQATQTNYNSLLGLLKNLTHQNKIQQAYQLKVV